MKNLDKKINSGQRCSHRAGFPSSLDVLPPRMYQVKCCFAIAKLAWQHAENRHRLVALKAALVVTQIFNKHPFDVAVRGGGRRDVRKPRGEKWPRA